MLERTSDDTLASVSGRKSAIEELARAMDGRTEQLDADLKRFSSMIDVSLRSAEDRARDAARLVAEATSEGARALAERHAAIRSTTEQEGKQTLLSLRELHHRVTSETKDLFEQNAGEANDLLQQATDRFAEIMHSMKTMSLDMQRELETTRKELRRGVLELPEETAESMAQMRRVIVDQMEALAELNRIVARHGRAMDTVPPATEQPAARRGYGDEEPVIPVILPDPASRPEAAGRGRAPASAADPTSRLAAGATDWNSLQRSRAEAPAPARPAAAATDWNSLQRGRTETSPEPGRPTAAGPERNAAPRGRVEPMPPEPSRPAAVEIRLGHADTAESGREAAAGTAVRAGRLECAIAGPVRSSAGCARRSGCRQGQRQWWRRLALEFADARLTRGRRCLAK